MYSGTNCHGNPDEFDIIRKLYDSGKPRQALNTIDVFINIDPECLKLHSLRCEILFNLNRIEEALLEVQFLENRNPGNAINYCVESLCYIALGDYEKAIMPAYRAAKYDASYGNAYYCMGLAIKKLKEHDRSLEDFKISKNAGSIYLENHLELIRIYIAKNDFKRAQEEVNRALKTNPENADVNKLMTIIAGKKGNAGKYAEALIEAYKNTGDNYYIKLFTGIFKDNKIIEETEQLLWNSYISNRNRRGLLGLLIAMYSSTGRIDMAEKAYEETLKNGGSLDIAIEYMNFLTANYRYNKVDEIADSLINKYGPEPALLYNKFYAVSSLGRDMDALNIIRKIYGENNSNEQYGIDYAIQLSKIGEHNKSISILENMLYNHKDSRVLSALYAVCAKSGNIKTSIDYAIDAVKQNNDMDFALGFPAEVIDFMLKKNYNKTVLEFTEKLIEITDGELQDIYRIYRCCVLSASGKLEIAMHDILRIKNIKHACWIIRDSVYFENGYVNDFLNTVTRKYLPDRN